mgnify:CR=1 FL=1
MFIGSDIKQLESFCPASDRLLLLGTAVKYFIYFVMISGIGYFTSIVQKFTILKLKDNVELSVSHLCLEFSVVLVAGICALI